jgi:hypothetical protein
MIGTRCWGMIGTRCWHRFRHDGLMSDLFNDGRFGSIGSVVRQQEGGQHKRNRHASRQFGDKGSLPARRIYLTGPAKDGSSLGPLANLQQNQKDNKKTDNNVDDDQRCVHNWFTCQQLVRFRFLPDG